MRRAFFLLLLLVFPIFAVAQMPSEQSQASQPTPKPHLKIGVAMEGGGALGIAHIGVLQWFEEQHVPVDFIAGTSMGGLVGGFYATGVSPADMKTLIGTLDWDEILSDRTPYEDLSFLRKQDQRGHRDRRAPRNAAHRRKRYSVATERIGAVGARRDFRKRNSRPGQRGCRRFRTARPFSDAGLHQKRSHHAGRVRSRQTKIQT